jgi:hypothetical protein
MELTFNSLTKERGGKHQPLLESKVLESTSSEVDEHVKRSVKGRPVQDPLGRKAFSQTNRNWRIVLAILALGFGVSLVWVLVPSNESGERPKLALVGDAPGASVLATTTTTTTTTTTSSDYTSTVSPTPSLLSPPPPPPPLLCLPSSVDVTVEYVDGNQYELGDFGTDPRSVGLGTYTFTGIPPNHPMRVYDASGTCAPIPSNGETYCTGTCTWSIPANCAGRTLSLNCSSHGAMRGTDRLPFDAACQIPRSPPPSPPLPSPPLPSPPPPSPPLPSPPPSPSPPSPLYSHPLSPPPPSPPCLIYNTICSVTDECCDGLSCITLSEESVLAGNTVDDDVSKCLTVPRPPPVPPETPPIPPASPPTPLLPIYVPELPPPSPPSPPPPPPFPPPPPPVQPCSWECKRFYTREDEIALHAARRWCNDEEWWTGTYIGSNGVGGDAGGIGGVSGGTGGGLGTVRHFETSSSTVFPAKTLSSLKVMHDSPSQHSSVTEQIVL